MKKIIAFSLLLLSIGASAHEKAEITHLNCSDGTYAYNKMSIIQDDKHLFITLKGATIFKMSNKNERYWEPSETSLKINKDSCRISEDGMLFSCSSISKLTVRRKSTLSFDDEIKEREIELRHFNIRLHKAVDWNGYESLVLNTNYVSGNESIFNDRVNFWQGCE